MYKQLINRCWHWFLLYDDDIMYKPRLIGWQDACVYHAVSRTAGRELLFGVEEREVFAKMLEKSARFCGI